MPPPFLTKTNNKENSYSNLVCFKVVKLTNWIGGESVMVRSVPSISEKQNKISLITRSPNKQTRLVETSFMDCTGCLKYSNHLNTGHLNSGQHGCLVKLHDLVDHSNTGHFGL